MRPQNLMRVAFIALVIGILQGFSAPPHKGEIGALEANVGPPGRQFAISFFKTLLQSSPEKNVVVSPVSASIALAMTYPGASRETRLAMSDVLGFGTMTETEILQSRSLLLKQLQNVDEKIEVRIANSVWLRKEKKWEPEFLKLNEKYFGAKVENLDFANPKSVKKINRWVDKSTKGKIKEIVGQIPPEISLFVINAVYFNGTWKFPFDAKRTSDGPFHLASGDKKDVPMMSRRGSYSYLEGNGFQTISLPYGEKGFRMVVFLPDKGVGLGPLLKKFTPENFYLWTSEMNTQLGLVALPRFEFENAMDLVTPLKELGLQAAFDGALGGFDSITEDREKIYITSALQKAYIKVNEEGTEAAAVTKIGIGITSLQEPPEEFQMIMDRPFLFAIHEEETDTILFLGAVYEP